MLCLSLFSLLLASYSAQLEFDLAALAAQLGPTGGKRAVDPGYGAAVIVDHVVEARNTRMVAKRQTAPVPCGGHDYFPLTALCTPARLMPTADAMPSGVGKRVLVVGDRNIGGAVCVKRHQQGAQMTCTNTESNQVRRAALGMAPMADLPAGIKRAELDFGEDGEPTNKAPERFVQRHMRQEQGYLPDEIYIVGNRADSGNPEDYTLKERLSMSRMHHSGWHTMLIELFKYRKFPQNINRTISVVFMVSGGAYAVTPGVLEDYYSGHSKKLAFTRHQNVKKLLKNEAGVANWRFRTLAGYFVNSTYYLYTKNPSALKGDTAQQQYLNFTIGQTLLVGNSLDEASTALIQVATLPLGGANHFQILPHQAPGQPFRDWSAGSFRTLENNLEDPLYSAYATGGMASLQINMNQHGAYELPAYSFESNDW